MRLSMGLGLPAPARGAMGPSDIFGTGITLGAFATGPGGAATVFSGRGGRGLNSGRVFVSGSGQASAVVQGRMVAADNSLDWLAAGETLAEYHDAIIANTNNLAVGAGTQDGGFKSLDEWVAENPSASIVTTVDGDQLQLADQTYYAVGVDFSNVKVLELGSGAFYALRCRFGGDNAGQAIQWDMSDRWIVELRHCDIVGNGDGTGAGAFIRRRSGGSNTGRLIIESCDFWGWGADTIQLRGNDKALFNRFDAPTSLSPTAVAYTAGTYQIGDIVVAASDNPEVASKSWINTLADNTDPPIFSPAASGNGWTLRDIHGDVIVMRPGDSGSTEVFGNVINTDINRRFHPNAFFGSINSALWGQTQGDYTNVECRGNLVMTNPDYNGGTPCSNLSNAIVAFNRIETRAGVENGVWLGVIVQAPVRIQGNTDPRYADAALSLGNGLTDGVHYTVISSESAETGDTMLARTGGILPHIYQGTYLDIATADGSGDFEGWITGAPRSLYAYKAQTRYRDAANPAATTSNHCFVGWVLAGQGQSDARWLGDTNFSNVSVTPTVARYAGRFRFITLQRDALTPAPVTESELIVVDVNGSITGGRDPIYRFANTFMELHPDGPVILMGHAVGGTNDRQTVDDADTLRYWNDELLIAQAGQPHLIDRDRPVAVDAVWWAYSSSSNYVTSAQALGVIGRLAFGIDPSGNPVPRDTTYTEFVGLGFTLNHFWSDLYDWEHSLLCFREHPNPPATAAIQAFEGHPVYGQYVGGFPLLFDTVWLTNGSSTGGGSWSDTQHPSGNEVGGFSELAAMAAAGISYAMGYFDPGDLTLDYIDWPEASGASPYVYVGIEGRDITSMRELYAAMSPPVTIGGDAILGEVGGFAVNGVRTENTALVTYAGQRRIRIGKQDSSNWTNADVLTYAPQTYLGYAGLAGTDDELRSTLSRFLDFPVVESGLETKIALPILRQFASTFFDNIIPAPAGPSLVHLGSLSTGTFTSAATPINLGSIVSDGRPILLALGTRGSTNTENGVADFPTAFTLGGVDILPAEIAQQDSTSQKATLYYIPTPAVGTLDVIVTLNNNSFANIVKAYHVENGGGLGPSPSSVGGAAGPAVATTIVSSAGGSMLVNVITSAVAVTGVSGGAFVDPVTTVGSSISMGVATTVVPGVGEKTTAFTVASFAHGVRLGAEILAPT